MAPSVVDPFAGAYQGFAPEVPLPEPARVRAWWGECGMLPNIQAHSEMVCKVALCLADWLAEAGEGLNRRAVEAGALVHDLAKTPCLGTDKLHALEGAAMLAARGYPELGYLVQCHVQLPPGHPRDETMVVNYADKRVKHDRVVGLDERYAYIEQRYGRGEPARIQRIREGRLRAHEVEAALFAPLAGRHQPSEIDSLFAKGLL